MGEQHFYLKREYLWQTPNQVDYILEEYSYISPIQEYWKTIYISVQQVRFSINRRIEQQAEEVHLTLWECHYHPRLAIYSRPWFHTIILRDLPVINPETVLQTIHKTLVETYFCDVEQIPFVNAFTPLNPEENL